VTNTEVVTDLSASMSHWVESSDKMIKEVQSLITSEGSHLEECQAACDSTLGHLTKISSSLRSANLNPNDDESFHALSPEVEDSWFRLTTLIRSVRSKDGDDEDVNFLLRTRAIETQFDEAVADVPKLSLASAKAANLEKVSQCAINRDFASIDRLICSFLFSIEYFHKIQGGCNAQRPLIGIGKTFSKVKCQPVKSENN
jgi:hypothetical protein